MNLFEVDQKLHAFMQNIFECLSLRELVKCRAVSRQFKSYADQAVAAVDELIVGDCFTPKDTNWHQTDRSYNLKNLISWEAFASVESSFKLSGQLKFLHIHLSYADLDFDVLNAFTQLVHLEIELWAKNSGPKKLNLPNLQVLYISGVWNSYVLNTPSLVILVCGEIEGIQVEHPETIRRLDCDCRAEENPLAQFKNLAVLKCRWARDNLEGLFLSHWKDLKEMDLSMPFKWSDKAAFGKFRSSLASLVRQKRVLKREELKMYLQDVTLIDAKQMVDYETSDIQLGFWFKNYRKFRRDSYPQAIQVDFNELMELVFGLSSDFFVKFPAIRSLTATGPVNRDDLEWFLSNASALTRLHLTNTSLDQAFMTNLPNINSRLSRLEVNESSRPVIDFNFILQFHRLWEFKTDQQIDSLELMANAFDHLKELEHFTFKTGNEKVKITRYGPAAHRIYALDFWNEKGAQSFCQSQLSWTELAGFYEQRRTAPPVERTTSSRVKRPRLK